MGFFDPLYGTLNIDPTVACLIILSNQGQATYFKVARVSTNLIDSEESAATQCLHALVADFGLCVPVIRMPTTSQSLVLDSHGIHGANTNVRLTNKLFTHGYIVGFSDAQRDVLWLPWMLIHVFLSLAFLPPKET